MDTERAFPRTPPAAREPAVHTSEQLLTVRHIAMPPWQGPPSAVRVLRSLAATDHEPPHAALPHAPGGTEGPKELRLFEALFSRDALIVADTLDPWYPRLTLNTVVQLAQAQGQEHHVLREEEPGRIPHEVRAPDDPVAQEITASSGWKWPYYGSIDATCLWLTAAGRCAERDPRFLSRTVVGVDQRNRTMAACVAAAIRWLVGRLESSRHTLLESRPMFATSIENQVWKDSWDAYSHADGTLGRVGTIASVEAQGLAYDALLTCARWAATIAEISGDAEVPPAIRLTELAHRLRGTVLATYGVEDPGVAGGRFLALATDQDEHGRLHPMKVLASNMGHLLLSGLLDGQDLRSVRRSVVESLFDPTLFCAAGFRTLSTREKRFRTTGYHTGNSWPWDSYRIARGLQRHGYQRLAAVVCDRIVETCNLVGFFPEFVAVDAEDRIILADRVVDVRDPTGRVNRVEQPPQLMQTWTVAAVMAAKRRRRFATKDRPPGAGDHESLVLHRLGQSSGGLTRAGSHLR